MSSSQLLADPLFPPFSHSEKLFHLVTGQACLVCICISFSGAGTGESCPIVGMGKRTQGRITLSLVTIVAHTSEQLCFLFLPRLPIPLLGVLHYFSNAQLTQPLLSLTQRCREVHAIV